MATNFSQKRLGEDFLAAGGPLDSTEINQPFHRESKMSVSSATKSLQVSIDFSRPDNFRNRALVAEGDRIYVCDHYMGVWSPVLRTILLETPNKELFIPSVKMRHLREILECISPIHKEISDRNYHALLPFAFDYQLEGLLYRCENFLLLSRLPFLERVWLADRYKLERLLIHCLKELRPQSKVDFSGPRYHGLSDRVKVSLLERLHGASPPQVPPGPLIDTDRFSRRSELNFATITGKTGRAFHINPFYVAAWSTRINEQLTSSCHTTEFTCGATCDELKAFLLAIHPPQLILTEDNIALILMSACKLESPGLMRKCAKYLLGPAEMSIFSKLSLIDRCFLHELLEPCLRALVSPEQALDMTLQATYDCLSTKARAAILDRLGALLQDPGLKPHHCVKCKNNSSCGSVAWVCNLCGNYSEAEEKPL